ncbi:IS5 family transposase [Pseudorhodobacter turbinis]|uniref:IS5 family transposase n=1 Tax=Pseudorhodobacter turbinis TaxID=2500533 RepID=A0A4P8EH00_9RHOB|nr:IS5 family transposase [Pseudorhodobacter turbinis]QCO55815.1 IS5 family transposase [Pseudorhodobacter turbinis]
MSKPSPARYRTTDWSSYTASLKKRGSLLIWLDKEMTWLAPHDGSPGRPAVFSDAAIQFCLTIKVLFKLPLRQTTGMVASLLKMADLNWAVPDYTTLCRRQKTLAVQIPYRRAEGPLNLLVDSTGIRFLGDGEWQARKHGVQGRRQSLPGNGFPANRERGRKVPLAMDTATSDIRAVEFTPSRDGDSPVLPELLDQIPEGEVIGTVTADGAYDTRRCHTAIIDRQATPIIPIRKNGRPWKEDCPAAIARNDTLRATRHYGRAFWKRWTGYHARSRIEAKMRCLKAFGERIAARDPDRQTAEIQVRIALINRFNARGTAEIVRVA